MSSAASRGRTVNYLKLFNEMIIRRDNLAACSMRHETCIDNSPLIHPPLDIISDVFEHLDHKRFVFV